MLKNKLLPSSAKLKNNAKLMLAMSLFVGLSANIGKASADERESLEQLRATTNNLIELLVQEGVLNKDKADAIVKKASQDAARQAKQAKADRVLEENAVVDEKSVRVQYVPEHIKKEMREEIKKEVMAKLNYKAGERLGMPSWLDRISFYGDMRLRFENNAYSESNALPDVHKINTNRYAEIQNTTEDRDRLRVRGRLGADVKVNDWLSGGLRMTTGQLTSPVSPNQTQQVSEGKYVVGLDRVFLKANPTDWLMVEGGRFSNPFFSTDMMFDPDLAFDGIAATFTPKFNDTWSSFTNIGAFPIEDIESSDINKAKSKWLYSLQTGIKWQAANKSNARLAVAYHDFSNVEGQSNSNGNNSFNATVPAFRQKGNNTFNIDALNGGTSKLTYPFALASKFQLINLTGQLDLLTFDPVHITMTGDYVKNIGFDANEIANRTGIRDSKKENEGYQLRLDVGSNSFNGPSWMEVKPNDWQVSLGYKRIEADAVLDGFTDSDFHLGGSDTKGWLLGANYAIDKNAWLSARYFSADSITGLPLAIDVLLLDFNAKF
ncbi:putative porin [Methylotenera sp.]|uniref:putative porin n=2 Tax=Methylotenera sp. TaxID=2051956 RepID=UPI00272FEA9C|nr:putative porin [Methylotenera sp.]MDP2229639.1 putative porin [Methylotenera sp.]